MKLYLSSYRIPDPEAFTEFVGLPASAIKIGLILNSKDSYYTQAERKVKFAELEAYFSNLRFTTEEIDLREYIGKPDELRAILNKYTCLWFCGGNTFSLRFAMAESGCDQILKSVLESGIMYAGDSAGAIVVGPTLKYFDNVDRTENLPHVIYEGLGLVDFSVLPHWGSEQYGSFLLDTKANLEGDGVKTMAITDDEFLLINNEKIIKSSSKIHVARV